MNKSEVVDVVSAKCGMTKTQTEECINELLNCIKTALKKGKRVTMVGFGTWEVRRTKAREGRNPRTGATIKIPAANQPKFKPGKALKDAVN